MKCEFQSSCHIEGMRFSSDESSLAENELPTLEGMLPEKSESPLGNPNRSGLEWVIDQYQGSTDKRSGITYEPSVPDDPESIVRPIGQVITVSLESLWIVNSLRILDT